MHLVLVINKFVVIFSNLDQSFNRKGGVGVFIDLAVTS